MKIRAFISQKAAERISDCQDRFAINAESKIVAVSDGVSQSIFPDYWAQILVNHYTAKGSLTEGERVLLCSEWRNWVLKYIEDEKNRGNNPWRTESNLYEGITAGATLCGVKFTGSDNWTCEVLGDSCLIVVHNNGTKIEILSSQEKEFDTYPDYLDSGAKKVLLPITSAADLGTVPSYLVGAFSLIFYSTPQEAVFKALGVE